MRNKYEVVTFDVGNTLVRVDPFERMFRKACDRLGVPMSDLAMKNALDGVWGEVWAQDAYAVTDASPEGNRAWWRAVNVRTLRLAGLPQSSWPAVEEEFNTILEDPAEYSVYPDALPTLVALRQDGYRLGAVSNWGWCLPDLCQAWGFADHLDFVVASARVGFAKPNPRIFREALRTARVLSEQMLHVGDSHRADVLGARGAGIDAVLVDRQGNDLHDDCVVVRSLAGVPLLLAQAESA
jgi:REG-2-like HAD superfamily hydrolase